MIRRFAFVVYLLLAAFCFPAKASAAPGQKGWGVILIATGGGLMAGAFNYRGNQCPPGYSTHTFQGLPTQCVFVSSNGNSDVQDATTGVTYARPRVLWAGVGAAAAGTVLLLLPKRVAKTVKTIDFSITPHGWIASKTVTFTPRYLKE